MNFNNAPLETKKRFIDWIKDDEPNFFVLMKLTLVDRCQPNDMTFQTMLDIHFQRFLSAQNGKK